MARAPTPDPTPTIPSGDATTDWWSIAVQVVATFAGLVTIVGGLVALFLWLVKPRFQQWVEGIVAKIDSAEQNTRQLTKNQGSHMADSVYRIEKKLDDHITAADRTITLYRYIASQHGIYLPDIRNDT